MKAAVTAAPSLEFTGERIVPGKTAESLFREHEERYVFAGQYVSGKDVLDVACGTGVGTSFLRRVGARRVWGIDIDSASIEFAKASYEDCQFVQSDATNLCLPDGSVDVVVSFETIEHVKSQREFLEECRRVLKPGGVLICSTPNLAISRWSADNPFHVRELHPGEFRELLLSVFPSVDIFAQKNRAYLRYVARTITLQALERLGLKSAIKRVLGRGATPSVFRAGFVNDKSALSQSIVPYRSSFLTQPTYQIAVAHKGLR
jgi:ubiquinone/menaquinone biosynthesis C-methylase UbiE